MDNTILESLEGYFGGQLNESTSDEDIMEAFADLLETADAVEEFLNEGLRRKVRYARSMRKDPARSAESLTPLKNELVKAGHRQGVLAGQPSPNDQRVDNMTHHQWVTRGIMRKLSKPRKSDGSSTPPRYDERKAFSLVDRGLQRGLQHGNR